ncbi:O-antigen ligase family protein [Bacteroidales bacterium OttesenSCG-928-C19]|nr:O-antigen ligase family protein [Bacteroidales bacterium OttesenSCG-928-C19]
MILLLSLQIFGDIGEGFQPIRIFVILCAPFILYFCEKDVVIRYRYRYERYFFLFWFIYGTASLFIAFDLPKSIKEILYLLINFFSYFTLVYFSYKASSPKLSIIKGWLILFLLLCPFSLYELWTNNHLGLFDLNDASFNRSNRRYTAVTFSNINRLNTVLAYMIPFFFGFLLISKRRRLFLWIICFIFSYIILSNGSRASTVCLFLGWALFIPFYFMKSVNKNAIRAFLFIFTLLIVGFFISNTFDDTFTTITKRFSEKGLQDTTRTNIINIALDELLNSKLLGIGAGNFAPLMENKHQLRITAPHNLFIEIATQYGIIVFILFAGLFIRLFLKQEANSINSDKFIVILSLITLPFLSIIDSSYLLRTNIWLFLASLTIISDKEYNNTTIT